MAVRHGYGKIAGADALVFAYDTSDTRNSYKGEPTENIVSTMGYAGFYGTSPELTQLGPDHYRLSVGGSNSGLYYSMGVQTGTWVMSYEYRAIQGDPGLGGHVDGTYGRWYVDGIEETGPTDGLLNLRSTANNGEWHKIYRIISNTNSTRNGGIFIQITRKGAGSYPAIAEIRNVQIENKARPTQYAGPSRARSATQGLLDLTGNTSIDLSTVSFDSNAQMTFDGTNDYGTIPHNTVMRDTETLTVESVFQVYSQFGYYGGIIGKGTSDSNEEYFLGIQPSGNRIYFDVGQGSGPYVNAVSTIDSNQYYHVVAMHERAGGTSTCTIYVNGEFISNTTSGATNSVNTNTIDITVGSRFADGSYSFNGDIPILKMYNRALTPAEVKNNFNNYKGRFNL